MMMKTFQIMRVKSSLKAVRKLTKKVLFKAFLIIFGAFLKFLLPKVVHHKNKFRIKSSFTFQNVTILLNLKPFHV